MTKTRSSKWPTLKPGDTIDVIAPGFSFPRQAISDAKYLIENMGYKAHIPKNLLGRDLICANSKEARWLQLKEALTNKKSKMIWCLRGGYGSIHLLPELQKLKKPARTKLFWGFSDATSLHLFLNQKWAWPTMHGPNLERFAGKNTAPKERSTINEILSGHDQELIFKNLRPMNAAANKKQRIQGQIIGGNLVTLASSAGSASALQAKGKILFLEEAGERAYRIDRMITQLEQSGALKSVKAVLFGSFLGLPDKDGVDRVQLFLKQHAKAAKIPVFSGLKVGHGKHQRPLPFLTKAVIQAGSKPILSCATGS